MKHGLKVALVIVVLAMSFVTDESLAGRQTVNIRLGGKYCGFYQVDVAQELKQIPGVTDVDFETMRGHVYVTMVPGKVHPSQLLAAIRRVKGEGYYCTAQFEGEPGRVQPR